MSITKLNQKDRIIEFPNRYKLTAVAGQSNIYDLESVTGEIVEDGTPFSKLYGNIIDNNFDEMQSKINPIYKYNGLVGSFDSVNFTANYNSDLDVSSMENNQRLLVMANDDNVIPPPSSLTINPIIYGSETYRIICRTLVSGNNALSVNFNDTSGYRNNKIFLYDAINGTEITNVTIEASQCIGDFQINDGIVLKNGDFLLAGKGYYDYLSVIRANKNLTDIIKKGNTYTMTNSSGFVKAFELDNGNIMITYCYGGIGRVVIYDSSLNVVKEPTQITPSARGYKTDIIQLKNGNIMYLTSNSSSSSSSTNIYITIIDQNGNVVTETTQIPNATVVQKIYAEHLSNGGVAIFAQGNNGYYDKLYILDNIYTLTQSITLDTKTNANLYPNNLKLISVLDNDLIITSGVYSSTYTHFNLYYPNGEQAKPYVALKSSNGAIPLYKISNKAVLGYSIVGGYEAYIIFDSDGNLITSNYTSASTGMYDNTSSCYVTKEIFFRSGGYSSSNTGHYSYNINYLISAIKLNQIDLDTLLEKNKYYELIYDEAHNKFIAEEVRNAN